MANNEEIIIIPTVDFLQNKMKDMSLLLYKSWKQVISTRLLNLELEGYIEDTDIDVPSCVWKLPNVYIRSALCKLESDLDALGYDYEFRFDVDDSKFSIHYNIELPEDCHVHQNKENVVDANYKHLLDKIIGGDEDTIIL